MGSEAVFENVGDEYGVQVVEVDGHGEDAADDYAGENDAGFTDVEAVEGAVDQGEDFEEGVVYSVDEGGVDVCE